MGETGPIAALVESICVELAAVAGRAERVGADCARIRERLSRPPTAPEIESLRPLLGLLQQRRGPAALPVVDLLGEVASGCPDPWPLLEGLLASRDDDIARRGLDLAERLVRDRAVAIGPRALNLLADRVEADNRYQDGIARHALVFMNREQL